MMSNKRLEELRNIRSYAVLRVGLGFSPFLERRVTLALNDAVKEIEELRAKLHPKEGQ